VATSGDLVSRVAPFGGRFAGQTQLPMGGPVMAGRFGAYPQASLASNFLPPSAVNRWQFPKATWSNSEFGFRLHSLIADNWESTVLFWHGVNSLGTFKLEQVGPISPIDGKPIDRLDDIFPPLNDIGLTTNRPLSIPGMDSSMFPLVLRAEGVWQDHTPFATRDPGVASGLKYSATPLQPERCRLCKARVMQFTSTGTLTANLEWNNYTILSPSRFMEYSPFTYQLLRHNEESFIFSLGTSWWWAAIAPQWVMAYYTNGNTFLLFPYTADTSLD
jgi:hypothetical protein